MKNLIKLLLIFIWCIFTGCSFVASRVVPLNDIKSPTGDYQIGTEIFYWIDSSRTEWFSDNLEDRRQLMVQAWYPAIPNNNKKYSWVDYSNQRVESLAESFNVPKFIVRAVDRVDTDTYIDTTPIQSTKTFPIVIFSHGFEGFRFQNTTQIQELVSHGYIVFALDHTYDATLTIFPDGTKIKKAEKYCYGCEEKEFREVFNPQIDTRISDVIFVLNKIENIKSGVISTSFSSLLDINKIGIFGHSFGGGTSLAASILDSRIKSCLSLDGWYVPIIPEIYSKDFSKPFLHLGQTAWDRIENYEILDSILMAKSGIGYKLSLAGAHHYDFTDSPHLSRLASKLNLSSELDSEQILNVTNTTVLGFFNTYLKNIETDWLEKLKSNDNIMINKFDNKEVN